jgi:hypothetical protein
MDEAQFKALVERVERLERENGRLRRDVRSLKYLRLGTLLLVIAAAAVAMGYERTQAWWRSLRERARDYEILEAALEDIIDPENPEYDVSARSEIQGKVLVLDSKSFTSMRDIYLPQDDLNEHVIQKDGQSVPEEIGADLRRRNSGESASFSDFKPRDRRILVRDLDEEVGDLSEFRAREAFWTKYPDPIGYVRAYLPGYSRDGKTAVVVMDDGPSYLHPRAWTFFLERLGGRWKVKWRHLHCWE